MNISDIVLRIWFLLTFVKRDSFKQKPRIPRRKAVEYSRTSASYVCHAVKYMWERRHMWALLTFIWPRKPCSQGDGVPLKKPCCCMHVRQPVQCPRWHVASVQRSFCVCAPAAMFCLLPLWARVVESLDWPGAHVLIFWFLTSQDTSHLLIWLLFFRLNFRLLPFESATVKPSLSTALQALSKKNLHFSFFEGF